jgi:D-3-phosphoglycerate dehydrogenase
MPTKPFSILIADTMHHSLLQMLEEKQWKYCYLPDIKQAEIKDKIKDFEGLIVRSKITIDETFLDLAPNLQFIARAGAGLDQIDLQAVKKRNIALINAPEGNKYAVAEHTIAMLLALFNHLGKADREVRNKIWDREGNRGVELYKKTIGIIGYGNMGGAVATCLQGFGCKVLGYDKYHPVFANHFAESVPMDTIFEQADIVSLHIPLTKETQGLVNSNFLGRFKKPIYLLNTARGEIVVLADLLQALADKKVLGACLDVLENEKLQTLDNTQNTVFEALANSNQVLFSPHVAGWTHESYRRINEVLVQKISELSPYICLR